MPNKIVEILKVGYSLEKIGVNNWALNKSQALNALEEFLISEISVLGGDVYENIDGIIQSNYDNWYCEPLIGENKSAFMIRSIGVAIKYIKEYKSENIERILFVFVPKI